jgi:hypothetical protein
VALNLGTHATIPDIPGLVAAAPLTNVELLELDRLPEHLIVLGGGYVGGSGACQRNPHEEPAGANAARNLRSISWSTTLASSLPPFEKRSDLRRASISLKCDVAGAPIGQSGNDGTAGKNLRVCCEHN